MSYICFHVFLPSSDGSMLALVDLFLRFPALVVFAEKIPAVF